MKRRHLWDGDTFEVNGLRFRVRFEHDVDAGYPWEDDDGCGPVRKSNKPHRDGSSDKRPGERPLNSAGRNEWQFYYDWQSAIKTARVDGWNAQPYDAPNAALRAVQENFDYCREFINDGWSYVGVIVERINVDGDVLASDSLRRVETFKDYHVDQAYEIAEALASVALKAWRLSLRLARQARHQAKVDRRFSDAMTCGV